HAPRLRATAGGSWRWLRSDGKGGREARHKRPDRSRPGLFVSAGNSRVGVAFFQVSLTRSAGCVFRRKAQPKNVEFIKKWTLAWFQFNSNVDCPCPACGVASCFAA